MARSSTTFASKWRKGKTTVLRVPEALASQVMDYARQLDEKSQMREPEAIYKTASEVDFSIPVNVAAVPQRSPFRYPGGKTWLVPYARTWLRDLKKKPMVLVEPFCGGAIVGLTAGFEALAEHVVLIERDENVAAVWRTIFGGQAEWLAHEIERFDLTREKAVLFLNESPVTQREKAFATLLRNRVQRGGIMAQGAGLVKNGENGRGILSRWYPETLARRIRAIATMRHRFTFIEGDGLEAIQAYSDDPKAVFFVDPPYTVAARRLYQHWQIDHAGLFRCLKRVKGDVLITYDNNEEIRRLAEEYDFETYAIAMKNTHHIKMTELIVGRNLHWLRNAQASAGSLAQTAQEIQDFPL